MPTRKPSVYAAKITLKRVKLFIRNGKMDEHKLNWLRSMGLAEDKSVIDCEPGERTVDYRMDDGTIMKRTVVEQWSRIMGYFRPKEAWNIGKQGEWDERQSFEERSAGRLLT